MCLEEWGGVGRDGVTFDFLLLNNIFLANELISINFLV